MSSSDVSSSRPSISGSISAESLSGARSEKSAHLRVGNLMGHAAHMLNNLEEQNKRLGVPAEKLEAIYTRAHENIHQLHSRLERKIPGSSAGEEKLLSKHEIKALSLQLKDVEKEIANVIRETQVEVATEVQTMKNGGERLEVSAKLFSVLENNGLAAKFIRLIAMVSKTHQFAVNAFDTMKAPHWQVDLGSGELSEVEGDKVKEFIQNNGDIDRRAGVIGLNGMYHFQTLFSQKNIKGQFKSFVAQNLSQRERKTIEREMKIDGEVCTSILVPLNREFDSHIAGTKNSRNIFERIFGTKGISSANRQEAHLINGWASNLHYKGKEVFTALRHAITSDKYEKDPAVRKENSNQAAGELLKAALMQEIASQGLTLEEAKEKGIQLNFNSVSLVTPDSYRQYIPGQDDEKRMLLDQISALKSFEGDGKTINLDGVDIPVRVEVNAFNFGVNTGAVNYKLGLEEQYEHNKRALDGLRKQCQSFVEEVVAKADPLTPELEKEINHSLMLMDDINDLLIDKRAYLEGGNQYEIEAKILNLTNVMDKATQLVNEGKNGEERISGFKCAFNCMSGKDRTGFLDGVAKAFAIMAADSGGAYPSHKELMENSDVRNKFIQVLKTVLLGAGSLEITEINTGAAGLKVGKEARLLGMSIDDFLDVQGLSSTTSS